MSTDEKILREIRHLHERLDDIEGQLHEMQKDRTSDLARLTDLADELGIARSTMYAKLKRRGIPVRDATGAPKEEGDRSAAFVSRTEWETGEKLHTRVVRREDGQYD